MPDETVTIYALIGLQYDPPPGVTDVEIFHHAVLGCCATKLEQLPVNLPMDRELVRKIVRISVPVDGPHATTAARNSHNAELGESDRSWEIFQMLPIEEWPPGQCPVCAAGVRAAEGDKGTENQMRSDAVLSFTPEMMIRWGQAGFNLQTALWWRLSGFTPEDARAWARAFESPDEALLAMDHGCTIDDLENLDEDF